jgi:Flp pilus assembly protein TadB
MRMNYSGHGIMASTNGFWGSLTRLIVLACAAAALLAVLLIGLFVILPLMLAGGIALHVYLRRRVRRAQQQPKDAVIDAEYTTIEHR